MVDAQLLAWIFLAYLFAPVLFYLAWAALKAIRRALGKDGKEGEPGQGES